MMRKVVITVLFTLFSLWIWSCAFNSMTPITPFDLESWRFKKEVLPEIKRKTIVAVAGEVEPTLKRIESSVAPWQKVLIWNYLNEVLLVEVGFETRNDFWSPNLKKINSLFVVQIPPKHTLLIVFPLNSSAIFRRCGIKGKFVVIVEAHERTLTGEYITGERIFYLDLAFHKRNLKVRCGKSICTICTGIKITKTSLRSSRFSSLNSAFSPRLKAEFWHY